MKLYVDHFNMRNIIFLKAKVENNKCEKPSKPVTRPVRVKLVIGKLYLQL